MKKKINYFEMIAYFLTIIGLLLLVFTPAIRYSVNIFYSKSDVYVTGIQGIFGDDAIEITWPSMLAFLYGVIAIIVFATNLVQPLFEFQTTTSYRKKVEVLTGVLLILSGAMFLFETMTFKEANPEIKDLNNATLCVGWIIGSLLLIGAGLLEVFSANRVIVFDENQDIKKKSRFTAALLAWFLGGFGAHKFYCGKFKSGVVYFIFWWTLIPSLISCIEFLLYLFSSNADFYECLNNK